MTQFQTGDRTWTDDPFKAKVWKRKSDLNSHLTLISQQLKQREKHGIHDEPIAWQVVPFVVKEVAETAVDLDETMKYEEKTNV